MVTVLISVPFRGAALIRREALIGERRLILFQRGHPKEQRLLDGGAYLSPGTY